jgi:hypothetical protein
VKYLQRLRRGNAAPKLKMKEKVEEESLFLLQRHVARTAANVQAGLQHQPLRRSLSPRRLAKW